MFIKLTKRVGAGTATPDFVWINPALAVAMVRVDDETGGPYTQIEYAGRTGGARVAETPEEIDQLARDVAAGVRRFTPVPRRHGHDD